MEKLKRYLIFLVGLFVNSLGVSLITKANLGTSPISSIPYVLSLNFPFTLGNFTIFFSIFLIVLQLIILRKNFKLEHILQIPVRMSGNRPCAVWDFISENLSTSWMLMTMWKKMQKMEITILSLKNIR